MTQTSRRRPFGSGGVEPSPTAQPPGQSPSTPRRQLARDTSTGRDGEIMARTTTGRYERVWMRPVGGGREWDVPREFVQLLDNAEGAA